MHPPICLKRLVTALCVALTSASATAQKADKPVTGPTAMGRALPEQMRLVHQKTASSPWLGSPIDERIKQLNSFLVLDQQVLAQARCDEAFFVWAQIIVMGCKRGAEHLVEITTAPQGERRLVPVGATAWARWVADAALWRESVRTGAPVKSEWFKPEEANHHAAFVGVYQQGAWQAAPLRAWEATAQHLQSTGPSGSRWQAIVNAKPDAPRAASVQPPRPNQGDSIKSDPRLRFAQSLGPDVLNAALAGQAPSPGRLNLRGENLLYYALLDAKDAALAKQLIQDGVDTRWVSAYGERTALMVAAGQSTPDVVQALADKDKTNLNAQSAFGLTALMYAAGAGRIGNARVLLTAGAKKDLKDARGRRAVDVAREAKQDLMVEVLSVGR